MTNTTIPIKAKASAATILPSGTRFILFASGVMVIAAVNRTVRPGVIANRLGNILDLIDRIEAPATILAESHSAKGEKSKKEIEFAKHQSSSSALLIEICMGGWSLSDHRERSNVYHRKESSRGGKSKAASAMPYIPKTGTPRVSSTEYEMARTDGSTSGSIRK